MTIIWWGEIFVLIKKVVFKRSKTDFLHKRKKNRFTVRTFKKCINEHYHRFDHFAQIGKMRKTLNQPIDIDNIVCVCVFH